MTIDPRSTGKSRLWLGAGLISVSLLTACVGASPRLPNDNDTTDNVPQPAGQPAAPAQSSGVGTPPDPGPGTPPDIPINTDPPTPAPPDITIDVPSFP